MTSAGPEGAAEGEAAGSAARPALTHHRFGGRRPERGSACILGDAFESMSSSGKGGCVVIPNANGSFESLPIDLFVNKHLDLRGRLVPWGRGT